MDRTRARFGSGQYVNCFPASILLFDEACSSNMLHLDVVYQHLNCTGIVLVKDKLPSFFKPVCTIFSNLKVESCQLGRNNIFGRKKMH